MLQQHRFGVLYLYNILLSDLKDGMEVLSSHTYDMHETLLNSIDPR